MVLNPDGIWNKAYLIIFEPALLKMPDNVDENR
jgi:hypothetical protein